MSWFLCVLTPKPFLEWEIEKLLKSHPKTQNTIIKPSFYFSYDSRKESIYSEKPTEDNPYFRLVLGRGYISKSTGYSQVDEADWEKLINFEFEPKDIDGHYLAFKIKENFLQLTVDVSGHYPVYYIKYDDYIIVSNRQEFIISLMNKKPWNYSGVSALALLSIPLEKSTYIKNISLLENGSTIIVKDNKLSIIDRKTKFITNSETDIQQYLFKLKKAFELQLNEKDVIFLPLEPNYSSRFAFSLWCHKPKKLWGLYNLQNNNITPDTFIDNSILNNLQIKDFPYFNETEEIFNLYRNFVLNTGLTDFPSYFYLAQNDLPTMQSLIKKKTNDIYILPSQSEWLFEKDPLKKIDKIFKIIKENNFNDFKKHFVLKNYFFREEFYPFLLKGLKKHFDDFVKKITITETIYDNYLFLITNYHFLVFAPTLAWLNDYKTFYSPAMLYSLTCNHLSQRFINPTLFETCSNLHLNFAKESETFPKPKDNKAVLSERINAFPTMSERINAFPTMSGFLRRAQHSSNPNKIYFPFIAKKISDMIINSDKVPYYNIKNLFKIFNKAQKGNENAINIIMKWTGFEIWREFLE